MRKILPMVQNASALSPEANNRIIPHAVDATRLAHSGGWHGVVDAPRRWRAWNAAASRCKCLTLSERSR